MDYKFIDDLLASAEIPKEGIHSRVLQKDEHGNIALFGFSAGQELSDPFGSHSRSDLHPKR